MLILCSDGLSSNVLIDRVSQIANNCKTAALVVSADPVYKEKNYHVPRCVQELEALGVVVDIFDLDCQDCTLLHNYDIVEFIGGNPFYLLNAIRTCHCEDILQEIARQKILIGWSAAAFVFGPSLDLVNEYSPHMNFLKMTDLTGLSLTQHYVLPHYSKFLEKIHRFEEICHAFESKNHIRVLRISDGDGLFIQGNHIELCTAQGVTI